MARPPEIDRYRKFHPCAGEGCGVLLPPSVLRFCPDCRKVQPVPTHLQLPGSRRA